MAKKKKEVALPVATQAALEEAKQLQIAHLEELETNPKYSLSVDPEGLYEMTLEQKDFIRYYIDLKNVNAAADLAGIDLDTARMYFKAWSTQQEVRRINMAMYQRQFNNKVLSVDNLAGYLSSLIVDDNVPLHAQLKPMEKVSVAKMLLDLHALKSGAFENPTMIMAKQLDIQIKNLSVTSIRQLLTLQNNPNQAKVIELLSNDALTAEEQAYLSTLPTEELLQLLDNTNKGDKHE